MTALFKTLRRLALLSLLFGLGGALSSCGRPANLALINVTGIDADVTHITELHVTMTLDGATAKNGQPTSEDHDNMSFTVYHDMQQFGIDVPTGTKTLGITINGINTSAVTIRTGSGTLDFSQRQDLDVALHTP